MPIRLDERVRAAINMIVGEYQIGSGESLSASEGLWRFIEEKRPDIAARVVEQVKITPVEAKPKKPKQK